jgi:hypothetical protein
MTMKMSDEMHAGGLDYNSLTGRGIRHVLNRANFTHLTPPLILFTRGILELSKRVGA